MQVPRRVSLACKQLGLEADQLSEATLRRRWRELVKKEHPQRAGYDNTDKFQQLRGHRGGSSAGVLWVVLLAGSGPAEVAACSCCARKLLFTVCRVPGRSHWLMYLCSAADCHETAAACVSKTSAIERKLRTSRISSQPQA